MDRTLTRFAIATWTATAFLALLFALFWRIGYLPPHGLFALLTTGAVVLAAMLTVVVGIRKLITGPNRVFVAATVLLGTTPVVWLAMYLLSLYLSVGNREPLHIGPAARTVAFWAASIGDAEARWKYPRWTYGKHVVLHDNGHSADPATLIAQMDEHFEQMAARLHTTPPARKANWVRGSLIGLHNHAALNWVICDGDLDSAELKHLDRHEAAHVFIALLGSVDQDPPMLLCEGWAESQSQDRDDMILTLADMPLNDDDYSLQALIRPEWYGRSDGPAYSHGGPLVIYLMEHYGPEKFLRLYHGVRRDTFEADCERILGDVWPTVEEQFWDWLKKETKKLLAERERLTPNAHHALDDVQLADSVKPEDWQTIVDGYRAARAKRPEMPKSYSFAWDRVSMTGSEAKEGEPKRTEESLQCVVDGDSAWYLHKFRDVTTIYCTATPGLRATVHVAAGGRVTRWQETGRRGLPYEAREAERLARGNDLGHFLPVDSKQHYTGRFKIKAVRPPAAPSDSIWEVEYNYSAANRDAQEAHILRIDRAADWSVVSDKSTQKDERDESEYTLATIFGRKSMAEQKSHTIEAKSEHTFHFQLRELDSRESQEVRAQVEEVVRNSAEKNWREWLVRPLTLAVGWPAVGAVLFFGGTVLRRLERNIVEVATKAGH